MQFTPPAWNLPASSQSGGGGVVCEVGEGIILLNSYFPAVIWVFCSGIYWELETVPSLEGLCWAAFSHDFLLLTELTSGSYLRWRILRALLGFDP